MRGQIDTLDDAAVGIDQPRSWVKTDVDITFRGMTPSPSVEAAVERWVARLKHVYDRIECCTVVVDKPCRRHRHGARFHVRIALAIPEHSISVSHDPGRGEAHTDVYVAVSDAFRAARRQLEDVVHDRRDTPRATDEDQRHRQLASALNARSHGKTHGAPEEN